MRPTIVLVAFLLAVGASAQTWPNCSPSASCMVPWGPQFPLGSKPEALGMSSGQLGVSVCYLVQPPASWLGANYCPDQLGRSSVSLGEWCQILRNLPLPTGGTQAQKDGIIQNLCVVNGA